MKLEKNTRQVGLIKEESINHTESWKRTTIICAGDEELFDGIDKVVHHFEVAVLQSLVVRNRRQEVVQNRHEEVHDHHDHREQVDDEKECG